MNSFAWTMHLQRKTIQENNRSIENLPHCSYYVAAENKGRSRTRNRLITKANYENILFLDADVLPKNPDFIASYLKALQQNEVVYGGINYLRAHPHKHSLHYRYGSKREVVSIEKRKKKEINSFSSANFAIQKRCLAAIQFDPSITSYGFEDLVFAKALLATNHRIYQIDNPVYHMGVIEDNQAYLNKEQESLRTLKNLESTKKLTAQDVRLLASAKRIQRVGLTGLYQLCYQQLKGIFLKNLRSKRPSLVIFDLYRLGYFLSLKD